MNFDMLLLTNEKKSSTKSLILKALAVTPHLSNVRLQKVLRKEFSKKLSYQTIRQALLELLDAGVLVKERKQYSISKFWVHELRDFVTLFEKTILKREDVKVLSRHTTQVNLKTMADLGYFILFSLEQKYLDLSKKSYLYMQLNHLWIPFSDSTRRERLKKVFRHAIPRMVVQGKTLGDRMLSRWYKQYGTVKIGTAFDSPCEYIVHGDTVVEIYMADALKKKMTDVYRLKHLFSMFDNLSEMTFKEYGIQLIITRNAAIADKIRKSIQEKL